ncbi:hypothetical protein ACUP6R_000428 [Vibrio navarrensis]
MIKRTCVLTTAMLLVGCGGGGGGATPSEQGSANNGNCGNMPDMACTYPLEKLTTKVTFSHSSSSLEDVYTLYIRIEGNNGQTSTPIQILNDHKFELTIGGVSFPLKAGNGGEVLTAHNLPINGQIYELYWYKGDDLIERNAVQSLAEPAKVNLYTDASDNAQIEISNWQPDNYQYRVDLFNLSCDNLLGGKQTYVPKGTGYFSLEDPVTFISFSDKYGVSYQKMVEDNQSCEFMVNVDAEKNLTPIDAVKKLSFSSYSHTTESKKLF